jgi:hypothetical protein
MIDGQRLSITTGSLDRLKPLKRSLSTWISSQIPDEILIVDWGNEIPLQESLKEFNDPRIIIAKAEDQRHWHNSKCHNLELQLASGERLLRLDNDCLLKPSFFEKHNLKKGCFFAGNWQTVPTKEDDKRNLTGTLYVHTTDALAVNGYNERLMHYGCEDDDLYDRLTAHGLIRHDIDLSTVEHIPHPDQQRYERLKISPKLPHPMSSTPRDVQNKIANNVRCSLTRMSRIIAANSPWTSKDHMTEWIIERDSPNRLNCKELSKNDTDQIVTYVEEITETKTEVSAPAKTVFNPKTEPPATTQLAGPHGIVVANQSFGRGLPTNVLIK